MAKLLLPLFVLAGLGAGVGGGLTLKPGPKACDAGDEACAEKAEAKAAAMPKEGGEKPSDFAELKRQFVVPILRDQRVASLVVASLAVEVDDGYVEKVFTLEPKLRDAFLRVLFAHAHSGGFDGDFTSQAVMGDLKGRLNEAAATIVGPSLRDVLITEIVRQDL